MGAIAIFCVEVFFCRILDVSISTLRNLVMIKGKLFYSTILAFIEAMVWFLIVREALVFDNPDGKMYVAIAFSLGFAIGTYIGSILAKHLIKGVVSVQVVTTNKNDEVLQKIQDAGFAITVIGINASKFSGEKYMILSEIKNNQIDEYKKLVHSLDNKAFIMVNETKNVYNGFFKP